MVIGIEILPTTEILL